jgi:hypothetical protein
MPGVCSRALPFLVSLALLVLLPGVTRGNEPSTPFRVLAEQVASVFPAVDTQVVDVVGGRVTLASGREQGVQAGLELTVVREGRELYHPTTKKLLGRVEDTLGAVVVSEVFDQYAVATASPEVLARLQPGDRARVAGGKVRLALVVLGAGKSRLVESATTELVQELERTGRFQVRFADEVSIWLTQERIAPEEFMAGRGLPPATERFKLGHVLAVHFTTPQGRSFMDVRLFAPALAAPVLQHAMFVPPSIQPSQSRQFSTAPGNQPEKMERRSLLTRLLSGDFEPNRYSAGAASIPIKSVAKFPFVVTSMDVAVAPGDKISRVVVTDGTRVFLYRLKEQTLEAEWTHDKLMAGQILGVQLADLDNDGGLEVVVNRQDIKAGMLSYILTTRNGRPAFLASDIPLFLLSVDEAGDGVSRTLWGQRYDAERFWTRGTATRYALKKDDVEASGRAVVHSSFRPTGATFSNIAGPERVLAFVDEQNRLVVSSSIGQEMWRSHSAVGGGGLAHGQVRITMLNMQVDKVFKMEPNPVSIDLDGDGVQEIVVPVNEDEKGRMGVVYRGPAGFRMQVVDSGFEGLVIGLGAIAGEGTTPTLVAAVVKRSGLLKSGGDTQIIVTVPE